MTPEALTELNRKIAVMEAYRDGREIEILTPDALGRWCKHYDVPRFNWEMCDYRVKPSPFHLKYFRIAGSKLFSGPATLESDMTRDTIEFIELTPEIRERLNL